eukprot:TRINITY_DN19094_c0_g1_i7.p4 TRINITY_DN19094_c0_g1~~TRINITY_DN19094_c0_g1_i7.p4  ORF type:complete len:189 (+),score=-15.03 TRINITY_DN19094_c0_g1_i7:488-1054(+)
MCKIVYQNCTSSIYLLQPLHPPTLNTSMLQLLLLLLLLLLLQFKVCSQNNQTKNNLLQYVSNLQLITKKKIKISTVIQQLITLKKFKNGTVIQQHKLTKIILEFKINTTLFTICTQNKQYQLYLNKKRSKNQRCVQQNTFTISFKKISIFYICKVYKMGSTRQQVIIKNKTTNYLLKNSTKNYAKIFS